MVLQMQLNVRSGHVTVLSALFLTDNDDGNDNSRFKHVEPFSVE